jgi:toxin ParE1/3/4
MREICLGALAERDLIDIWCYTFDRWGPAQADRYLEELDRGLARLVADPGIGTDRQGVRNGYRVLFIKRHAVYYKCNSREIEIIRVLHGQMDPEIHLPQ